MRSVSVLKQVILILTAGLYRVNRRRLELLGHLFKMDQIALAENIFKTKPEGIRIFERSTLKWLEVGENDLREHKLKILRQNHIHIREE
jgi:hypothetical protein